MPFILKHLTALKQKIAKKSIVRVFQTMKNFFQLLTVFVFAVAPFVVRAQDSAIDKPAEIDFVWGVKIPLRDNIKLNATVYKPKPQTAPLPVILRITPYIADSHHQTAAYFARNGYVFVTVDSRGRGSSEGKFNPFANEAADGFDTVEWLAKQPFCNGKVGMWGGSYGGYNQWATLKEFPTHLKTIVPTAAVYPGLDFPMWNNISYPYAIQWLTFTSGATGNSNLFGDFDLWNSKFMEVYLNHLPFNSFDKIVGNETTVFQTYQQHPHRDRFWEAMTPTDADYARMNLPILTITGHYDGDQPGAMEYYRRHQKFAEAAARDKHFLVVGPYDHGGTRTPRSEVGGVKFGAAALLDMLKLHREWYDWTLKDRAKPEFLKKPIAYYVAGETAENWKYADSLDQIATEKRVLYLNSNNSRANDVFAAGSLTAAKPTDSAPDKYVYDPLDTRPAELYKNEIENYLTDQTATLNLFGNGLIYHTEPFAESVEITGNIKFSAHLQMNVPDTDFAAAIYEILPDGSSILLTQAQMRARYRESAYQEKLIKPAEINRYDFNNFMFFSRLVRKGSRLRLILNSPNSPLAQKNYNSGGAVAAESKKDARTANITLYHDAARPSFLELPIVKQQ